jgi:hypothetical protein
MHQNDEMLSKQLSRLDLPIDSGKRSCKASCLFLPAVAGCLTYLKLVTSLLPALLSTLRLLHSMKANEVSGFDFLETS